VGKGLVIWLGGTALLAAALADTLAVIGRHVGLPIPGSIELIQAIVLFTASTGLVVATWADSHARVRLVVDRLNPRWRAVADRLSDLLTLVFCVGLLVGSAWLAADLWHSHEQSELLGIPWLLLRLFANASLLALGLILLVRILRSVRQ
jgi:TRAP-type C4-dicarboxylate transport system permease small subunit